MCENKIRACPTSTGITWDRSTRQNTKRPQNRRRALRAPPFHRIRIQLVTVVTALVVVAIAVPITVAVIAAVAAVIAVSMAVVAVAAVIIDNIGRRVTVVSVIVVIVRLV